jgi:hypothetical protein
MPQTRSCVRRRASPAKPTHLRALLQNRLHGSRFHTVCLCYTQLSAACSPHFNPHESSMLLNLGSLPALVERAAGDAALILTTGIITFVAGLAIVRIHNRWNGGWPVVVTILGWLFLLGGLARTLFPIQLGATAAGMAQNSWISWIIVGEAVVLLALGGFLSIKARMTLVVEVQPQHCNGQEVVALTLATRYPTGQPLRVIQRQKIMSALTAAFFDSGHQVRAMVALPTCINPSCCRRKL